ncbi:MAG: hypothetical protein AVDCRST_MAG47-93 [uncultured Nocardioidaceae bacterium]|uniref:Uncharacterized protein n=1 Tax=uncultured Nocardioidaceae bacterium TaxID=253824 RepID=A0A6J4MHY1_9ACTN|nr:MAG: hypothetical protein AVDCRST_MAG47-93 [uncultured Nocardioidaceae bacterium]
MHSLTRCLPSPTGQPPPRRTPGASTTHETDRRHPLGGKDCG